METLEYLKARIKELETLNIENFQSEVRGHVTRMMGSKAVDLFELEKLQKQNEILTKACAFYASTSRDFLDYSWESDNSYDPDRYVIHVTDREWIEGIGEIGGKRARQALKEAGGIG